MSWQRPSSDLRASDAERERVVEFLREHALVGRLNHDELEERIGLAYHAVTRGDLERLIGDLPRRDQPVARRPRPTRAVERHDNGPKPFMVLVGLASLAIPMAVLAGVLVAIAVVVAMSMVVLPLLILALVIAHAARRRRPGGSHGRGMAGGFG